MNRFILGGGAALLVGLFPFAGQAADHIDSPATEAEPAADITDVYAWMSPDTEKLNLVMNVHHNAGDDAVFSDAVTYVFHVNSSASFGASQTETQIICKFYDVNRIECWAGDEYLEGDASAEAGITNNDESLRVFAGLRNDPFFFELVGFKKTVELVVGAAPDLTFDEDGCPSLDSATSSALVSQLQSGEDHAPASNTFAGSNILSLVAQVDVSVVNGGGPILGVWGSTHMAE